MPDKSISELWNEMSDILGTIPKYEDYPLLYARPMREANERLNTLRATLLEQCISEYGLKIQADAFEGLWIHEVWIAPIKISGASDTRNRASLLNFMAWELEQRQREAGGK